MRPWRPILRRFYRFSRRIFFLFLVLLLIYLAAMAMVGFFLNPHVIRATFIKTIITSESRFFEDSVSYFIYESPEVLSRVRLPNLDRKYGEIETIESLLVFIDRSYYGKCHESSIFISQRPSLIARSCIEKGLRGSCYNDAILFNYLIQSLGYRARNISLDHVDGFGGSGHAVVEVWSDSLGKWIFVDAQNLALILDSSGIPLSAIEIRKSILKSDTAGIAPVQFGENWLFPRERLLSYYKEEMPTLVLIRRNDFESRFAGNPFMGFLSYIEGACGRPCLLFARLMYSVLTNEERVVYADEFLPGEDQFILWHRIMGWLSKGALISFLLFIMAWIGNKVIESRSRV